MLCYSLDEYIYFVERKYLQPATKIGPAPEEVIPPLILAFESASSTSSTSSATATKYDLGKDQESMALSA